MIEQETGFRPDDAAQAINYRGAKFADQFEALKKQLAEIQEKKGRGDASALDVLNAELTLEEFVGEHDNAGAYKSERFGEDLSQALDGRADGLMLDDDGHLTMHEADERSQYLMISVTELDHTNEEGGHDAGNQALANAVRTIEQSVREELEKSGLTDGNLNGAYDIYRLRGSDFMLRLNTGASGNESDQRTTTIERAIQASPTLTAVSLRLDRAMELFNRLQDHLPEQSKAEGKDVKRLLIEAIKRSTEFSSEVARLCLNLTRAKAKKTRGDADARSFFDSYIAKSFAGTPFADFEHIDTELTNETFNAQATETALNLVATAFARERQTAQETEAILLDAVAKRPLPKISRLPDSERAELSNYTTLSAAELAKRQSRTKGSDELAAFRRQLEAAKADPSKIQKAVEHYGALPQGVSVDYLREGEAAKALRIVEKRLRVQENSTDRLTGLPNRGAYYASMRERHLAAEASGEEVRTFFIDMAFLKYFNQEGGRDVGNFAIQTAAELLEAAVETSGVKNARVFRYAGDEFTILFDGGDEQKLTQAIEQARHDRGAIERSDASADLYRPEALQFNYGASDRAMTGQVLAELESKGLIDGERMKNDQAYRLEQWGDISTRLADAGVGADKAFSRLSYLMRRLSDETTSSTLQKAQTDALIRYSKKAVFGMDAAAIRSLGADVQNGRVSLRTFVMEQIEKNRITKNTHRNALNEVIQQFARERFLQADH